MNKALVDRELLERTAAHLEWDGSEPMTTIQFAHKCDALADELRRSIAQPAEAEGVKVVAFMMRPEFYDPYVSLSRDSHCTGDVDPLVLQSDHLAALSAVTAERDRLREALEDLLGCPANVVQATVPKAGIEAAPPYQVVLDVSVSLTRWRKAKAAMDAKEA